MFFSFTTTSLEPCGYLAVKVVVVIIARRVDLVHTWVPTHPLSNFYSRHINPFLVCFPSRAQYSGVQKWFQNFDLIFFHQRQLKNRFCVDFLFFGLTLTKKNHTKNLKPLLHSSISCSTRKPSLNRLIHFESKVEGGVCRYHRAYRFVFVIARSTPLTVISMGSIVFGWSCSLVVVCVFSVCKHVGDIHDSSYYPKFGPAHFLDEVWMVAEYKGVDCSLLRDVFCWVFLLCSRAVYKSAMTRHFFVCKPWVLRSMLDVCMLIWNCRSIAFRAHSSFQWTSWVICSTRTVPRRWGVTANFA
jgi:hypothetical protein